MLTSMTGIAALSGAVGPYDWSMELRGVNNKGLDIRARVPDWLVGLDQFVRKAIAAEVARGSLQFSLKVSLSEGTVQRQIDLVKLEQILTNAAHLAMLAKDKGLDFAPIGLSDISSQNGFMDFDSGDTAKAELMQKVVAELPTIIAQLQASRQAEGQALHAVLEAGVVEMERLLQLANKAIENRADEFETNFKAAIVRLKQDIEPSRLAQEMAILAVKSDVTEEIDRLIAHLAAARALLASHEPAGRKFDFLMQEFNREANTLCSKSNSKSLTAIGLEMKVLIDQMREQVQNVE
ncbi:YicC family protein [Planktomarina sp.]|nr:YicC family protein [Planktomarina sp.]